jgi:hypothetical protein
LLLWIHRCKWPAKVFPSAGFYFDKDERIVIAADDIDLAAAAAAKIAAKNLVTIVTQKTARQSFAARPASEMIR